MITVFVVLALVVVTGNLLIRFVNTFLPEQAAAAARVSTPPSSQISPKKIAAITSAVHQLSGGKAGIEKIEKL